MKNPLLGARRRRCARIPARGPRRAHRHPGGEQPLRAVGDPRLDHARPARPARRRSARRYASRSRRDRDAAGGRAAGRGWSRPFLLRRRKSDPGIAPGAAAQDRDRPAGRAHPRAGRPLRGGGTRDHGARSQASDGIARRGLVLKLLTALKQICNHPAQYLKEARPPLAGRSGKLELLDELLDTILAEGGSVLVFTQYVAMARLLERHLADARHRRPSSCTAARPVAAREADGGAVPGGRGAGVPALAQGRRHRAEPHPRRPRRPLRPLVEPGRRGPGHRPRVPHRPDPPGAGAPAPHRGHGRGPDRRAARRASASWPTPCSAPGRRR